VFRSTRLADVYGCDTRESAGTETRNDTGDEDEVGADGPGLEGAADEGEDCADKEAVDAPDAVGGPAAEETAYDGAEVVLGKEVVRFSWQGIQENSQLKQCPPVSSHP
jgi:hypothetical protein